MIKGSDIIKNRLTQNQAIILNVKLIGLKEIYSSIAGHSIKLTVFCKINKQR